MSQRENRNDFMQSYTNRHRNAAIGMGFILSNTAIYWTAPKGKRPANVAVWAGMNAAALGLWYGGYLNPEIVSGDDCYLYSVLVHRCVNCRSLTSCVSLQMLRPRNHNAVYLSTCEAAQVVKDNDLCVITQLEDQEPCAYPDKQVCTHTYDLCVLRRRRPNRSNLISLFCAFCTDSPAAHGESGRQEGQHPGDNLLLWTHRYRRRV